MESKCDTSQLTETQIKFKILTNIHTRLLLRQTETFPLV